MDQFLKNFSNIFSSVFSNFSSYFIKTFIYIHFHKLTTKFSQNQGKLYNPSVFYWLQEFPESFCYYYSKPAALSIAARATVLIGIYESDNGRKGEQIFILHIKSIKDIPLCVQLALSFFSSEHSDCTTLWWMHASNSYAKASPSAMLRMQRIVAM